MHTRENSPLAHQRTFSCLQILATEQLCPPCRDITLYELINLGLSRPASPSGWMYHMSCPSIGCQKFINKRIDICQEQQLCGIEDVLVVSNGCRATCIIQARNKILPFLWVAEEGLKQNILLPSFLSIVLTLLRKRISPVQTRMSGIRIVQYSTLASA